MAMTIITRLVRPEHIKKAIFWAAHIAISFAGKWWRKRYEK